MLLRFQNSGALPGGQSLVEMAGGTLTIGRGEENDLALPDPDRTLSKRHCVLEERNGDYVIVDISTNGTFLNYGSERLGDIPTPLNHGDVIIVGSFEFVVEISADGALETTDPELVTPLPPADDVLATPDYQKGDQPHHDPVGSLDDLASTGADFLDDLLGNPANLLAPRDPFLSDSPHGPPDGPSTSDHSPASQDHFSAPGAGAAVIPDDWDDLVTPQKALSRAAPKTRGNDEPFSAPPAPKTQRPAMPVTPPFEAPTSEAMPSAAPKLTSAEPGRTVETTEAAARAFLDAAGAGHLSIPATELEDTMARMGRVLAAMIAGMREILMARASIKSEMRMNRTMINMGQNNPLKFSISAEQAVEAMIRPSVHGYIDAEAATTEALNDIKAHEVAMMSGMEAALKDLLARLGPEQLSARIESSSTLGSLLSGKKARYWEAYEKMYAKIAKETEDDFQSTFGREFARAYEAQSKKL